MTRGISHRGAVGIACAIVVGAFWAGGCGGSFGVKDDGDDGTSGMGGDSDGDGTGGSTALDCTGLFGDPIELFSVQLPEDLGGPSITSDELELYYAQGTTSAGFVVRTRATTDEDFGDPIPVPGLTDCVTPYGSVDVSDDGLRIYSSCWSDFLSMNEVRMAERANRDDPFVDVGVVGQAGATPSVSHDELSLHSTGLDFIGPLVSRRESIDDSFGTSEVVAGLEGSSLANPDLSSDELVLFGNQDGSLGYYERASASGAFGEFISYEGLPENPGAPSVTPDCRAMYFIGVVQNGGRGVFRAIR